MTPDDPPAQTSTGATGGSAAGPDASGGSANPAGATGATGGSAAGPDPLDALRERIRLTLEAVERLTDEAQTGGQASPRPPGNGYEVPDGGAARAGRGAQAVAAIVALVRGLLPRELSAQLTELARELLLLARALIDWWVDRVEGRRREPVEVQDIPIS